VSKWAGSLTWESHLSAAEMDRSIYGDQSKAKNKETDVACHIAESIDWLAVVFSPSMEQCRSTHGTMEHAQVEARQLLRAAAVTDLSRSRPKSQHTKHTHPRHPRHPLTSPAHSSIDQLMSNLMTDALASPPTPPHSSRQDGAAIAVRQAGGRQLRLPGQWALPGTW
jgi:hypothetical protein